MLLLLFLVSHTRVVCDVPRGTRYVASTWNVYRFHLEPTYNNHTSRINATSDMVNLRDLRLPELMKTDESMSRKLSFLKENVNITSY